MRAAAWRWGLVLAVVGLLAAGCGTGEQVAAPQPTEPPPQPAEPADPVEEASFAGSWTEEFTTVLPHGFELRYCLGERLDLCVHRAGALLGDLELAPGYPLDPHEADLDPAEILHGRARSFLEHYEEDRGIGCAEFAFSAEEITEVVVGGEPAVRTGFALTADDGRVVERVVNYYLIHDDELAIVNVDAYALEDGCLPPSDTDWSFTPEDLDAFAPYLDRVVADTPLI